MKHILRCVGALCVVVWATGCSSVAVPNYEADPRVVELRTGTSEPLEFGLTVGLPVIASSADEEGRHSTAIDTRDMQRMLVELISTEKLFRTAAPSSTAVGSAQLREGWDRLDDLASRMLANPTHSRPGWFTLTRSWPLNP